MVWVFVNMLAKESGDKDFTCFFGEANAFPFLTLINNYLYCNV